MSAHPTPAERLLAMLEDEQAIEGLPAEEIRTDLDAVGIDPGRSIAFARALAAGSASPGGRLLGAIDFAEDAEDEIARLENADIEDIRAQIPGGTAAAIAAEARRQAGEDNAVVALKPRRRSRALRWGGPLAGIAASVIVVAVVGVQLLDRDGRPAFEEVQSAMEAPADAPPAAPAPRADVPAEPFALERKRDAAPDDERRIERFAKQARDETEAPAAPPAGTLGNLSDERAAADRSDERAAAEGLAAKPTPGAEPSSGAATVAAMVIVDPSQVPLAVQSQARPQPDLAARLDEARRLAGDRPVVALYRVAGPAGRQDFAQVPLQAPTQQMPAPSPLTRMLGPAAVDYDFLALPEQ